MVKNKFKILSFCSADYVPVALNWVGQLEKFNITNYVIISTDEIAYDKLKSKNVNTELNIGTILKRSGTGWKYRFQTTYQHLQNQSILHSDLDAVWIKNPLKLIDKNYDIIASMDSGGWPKLTYDKWGFTMCMGWIYFRSNECVLSVFEEILKNEKDFDDQEELNNHFSIKVDKSDIYYNNQELCMNMGDLKLKVLSEDEVFRGNFNEKAYVCHPLMKKHANREKQLKKRGLWFYDK